MPRKGSSKQAKEQATLSFDTVESESISTTPIEKDKIQTKKEILAITVSELDDRIRTALDCKELTNITVTGEITGLKPHGSGHLYFSLTEKGKSDSSIPCIIWKSYASKIKFPIKDGSSVNATGYVDFYPPSGKIQFIISKIEPALGGIAGLYLQKEKWKKELEAEGVIPRPSNEIRKIPDFPSKIGVVTSRTGSVLQDIKNVISRRFPTPILLAPAQVQGAGAEITIVSAIKALQGIVDVIIVARGGGSFEDLFVFNHPDVVRAIRNSKVPIISAIGHETDFTLADFACDLRCPTPSAAAEKAVPDRLEILKNVEELRIRIYNQSIKKIHHEYERIDDFKIRMDSGRLTKKLNTLRQQISEYNDRIQTAIIRFILKEKEDISDIQKSIRKSISVKIQTAKLELEREKERIVLGDPKKPLDRGYAMIQKNGLLIRSTRNLSINDRLNIHLSDGSILAKVDEIKNNK